MRLCAGMTLIEVLVSVFLLSLLLIEWNVVQVASLREVKAAYYYTAAAQQLDVLAERLAAQRVMSVGEWENWTAQNTLLLPQGAWCVEC